MLIDNILQLSIQFEKLASAKSEGQPIESLMLEHSILDRVLLVYEECIKLLEANDLSCLSVINKSAKFIKENVELHHEKVEEKCFFPKLTDANKLNKVIATLIEQHKTSRKLTDEIISITSAKIDGIKDRYELITLMQSFIRMYRSHATIENTIVFPELRNLYDAKEMKRFSRWFEKKEKAMFGEDDFGKLLGIVSKLEKEVDINKLEDFTP